MDHDLPTTALADRWSEVEADLEATAEDLAADGWFTLAIHPGDVTTHLGGDGREPGLDVLVPDNEFEAVRDQLTEGAEFGESAVFRQSTGGVAFLICVFRDPDRETAVLVPAFYPQRGTDAQALAERARSTGEVRLHLQPIRRDPVVTFTIDDPSLVFPSE